KERAKRIQCLNNLKQFTTAMYIYAADSRDNLPASGNGSWIWDLPWKVGDLMDQSGAKWKTMYCPGTSGRFSDQDNFNLYYVFATNAFHVLGYAMTLDGTPSLEPTNVNKKIIPQPITTPTVSHAAPSPTDRVLTADATVSLPNQSNPAMRGTYNYADVPGGYSKHHISPHLDGKLPSGGNVGMLDGHVEWRKFPKMDPRTVAGSGSPVFWW
ncbi:MAG TPA: DUF1559 domain-containing protein, partial [Bacillota bacterium]|nr:DUF1559 domain-containing protein [Bacillota bacterium]